MQKKLGLLVAWSIFGLASVTHADSILRYENITADGSKIQRTLSITGRWVRIDSDAMVTPGYTLMDTGRMLRFDVDDDAKTFTVTHMGRLYWPSGSALPRFKPTREHSAVAGVRCRKVEEIAGNKTVAEHCMTAGGPLGLNPRETITLSRLFMSARRMGMGWLGVATPDERQVSIRSQAMEKGGAQEFKSIIHAAIPDEKIKIPDEYRRIQVEQFHPPTRKPRSSLPATRQ